jgi:hypothetical protein
MEDLNGWVGLRLRLRCPSSSCTRGPCRRRANPSGPQLAQGVFPTALLYNKELPNDRCAPSVVIQEQRFFSQQPPTAVTTDDYELGRQALRRGNSESFLKLLERARLAPECRPDLEDPPRRA